MSRNDTETQEALDLDQRWDELSASNPAVRRLDRGDQELRELIVLDGAAPPSAEFVAGLMGQLRVEARQIDRVELPAATEPVPTLEPMRPVRRMRRMGGLSGVGKVASVLLAASLLFGMMAALVRYPFTSTDGTGGPTVIAPGPQIPDVPMPGADPARTNVQPGPGPTMLPEIKQKADMVGTSMALADNVLVILIYGKVRALDANTLTELWSKDLDRGSYSAPTIAGGAIYFGYTFDVEGRRDRPDNDQLVALSLVDGHELWRVTGAGVFPASPIAADGIVYALGGTGQQYNVGAYQAADGKQLWRIDVVARGYCCPDMGIALANGKLAVSLSDSIAEGPNPHTVGVYDAANGAKLWLDTDSTAATVGEPAIVDGLLIINEAKEELFGTQTQQEMKATSGATVAYDLTTGAVRWSNESTRTHRLPVASVPEWSAALYVGPREDADGGQLALLSLENGQPIWNEALPHVLDDPNIYSPSDVPPVVVGDTAYVVGSTQMLAGGNVRSSLLSAVDLATGKARWMAQIDGGIVGTPIVAGGKIFVLTIDAGLSVLGESATSAATPATTTEAAVIDLRTPVVCNAAPSDSPMLGDLPATPTIQEVAPWHQSIPFSSIISGKKSNVDATTGQQLEDLFNAYRACSAVDPYHGVFGFFSTDFYVRLKSVQEYWGEPEQPWAVWMAASFVYLKLDTSSLQMLPDGRIGGLINGPTTNVYVWFVQENGQWMIDEYHPIAPDPITPTTGTPVPSTNPEGTPLG